MIEQAQPDLIPWGRWRGCVTTRPRHALSPDELGPDSQEFEIDPIERKLQRRGGSAIFGDTLSGGHEVTGILESTGGARALSVGEHRSDSLTNGYPVPGVLFADEPNKKGTFAWYDSNTAAYRQIGRGFDNVTQYINSGAAGEILMKIPPIYSDGATGNYLRCSTATLRQYETAGCRKALDVGGRVYFPDAYGTPTVWNKIDEKQASGTQRMRRVAWGLPPPLFAPECGLGADLGAGAAGPYLDGDVFYITQAFEFADGSVGPPYQIVPGATTPGRHGVVTVGNVGATHAYASLTVSKVAIGPYMPVPCVARRVYVSKKVHITAGTSANAVGLSEFQLYAVVRIANNTSTSFSMFGGEQTVLTADAELRFDHRWPPRAQFAVPVDGRAIFGGRMTQNPLAIIVAPLGTGAHRQFNASDDDTVSQYGTHFFHVRIDGTNFTLKHTTGGVTTKLDIALSGQTLQGIVDKINESLYTDTEGEWCAQLVPGVDGSILATNLARTDSSDFGGDDSANVIADGTTGNARAFGANYPFYAAFSKAYMDLQPVDYYGTIMTTSGPTKPDGSYSLMYLNQDNQRGPMSHASGDLLMVIPVTGAGGVVAVYIYQRHRYMLRNTKSGGTGDDADYRLIPLDLTHGACSFLACFSGPGFAGCVGLDGLFITDGQSHLILSRDHYNKEAKDGTLAGALAAEILASDALTSKRSVPFLAAGIVGNRIRIRFRNTSGDTMCNRGIDYLFGEGHDGAGVALLLRQDQSGLRVPYGWSCPAKLHSYGVFGEVTDGTGRHTYGAIETNAGTGNGRLDEFDLKPGTSLNYTDNGTTFTSKAYTNLVLPESFEELAYDKLDMNYTKAGTGLSLTLYGDVSRNESAPITVASSGSAPVTKTVFEAPHKMRGNKNGIEVLIQDDGTVATTVDVREIPCRVVRTPHTKARLG